MYLDALREDISGIEGVLEVVRNALTLEIEVAETISAEVLKERIRPTLNQSMLAKLRLVSLVDAFDAA